MIKKGQAKNLGLLQIIVPNSKSYRRANGVLHILEKDYMTYYEAEENAKHNYPGWRLPTVKECQYVNSLYNFGPEEQGITGLNPGYYWTSEEMSSRGVVINLTKYSGNSKIFYSFPRLQKFGVFYVKDSLI